MEDEGPPRLLKRSQQGTRSKRTRKREQIRTRPTPASYEEETLTRLDTQPRPNRGRVGPSYRKTDYSSQPQSSMLPALCPAQPWSQKRPASLKPQCAQESSPWTDMDRQQAQPFLTVAKPPRFRHSYPAYANMGDSALFKKTDCRPPVCEGRAEEAGRSYLYGQLTRGMAGSHQSPGNQAGRPSQHEDKTSVPSDRNQTAPFPSSGVMSQVNQAPPPSKVPDICQVLDKSTGAAIESTAPATLRHLPVPEGKGLSHPELQTTFQKQLHPKLPKDRLQPILPRASSKKMAPAKSKRDQIQCDVFSEMVTTKRLHSEMTEDRPPQCLSDSTVESPLLPTADFRPGTQLPTIKAGSATLQTVLGQPPVLQRCSVAEASPRVGSGSLYAEKPFQPLHPATFPHKYSTMRSNDVATKNRNMNSKHVTTDHPSKYERTKKKSKKTRKISFVKTFSKINDLSVLRGRTTRNINKYIPFQEMMTRENCGRDNINNHAVEDDNPVENQLPNINSRPPNSQGESQGSSDKVNTRSSGSKSTRGSVITQDSRAQDQKLEESSAISHPSSFLGQGVESRSMDSSFQDSGVMLTSTGEADESETVVISLDRKDDSDEDMNKEDSDLKEKEPEKTTKRTRKMTTKLKVKSDEVRKVSSTKDTGKARRRGKVSRTHPNLKAIKGRCPSRVERGVSVSGEDAQPHSSDTLLSTASASHLSTSSTGLHASSTHLLDSSTFSSNYQDETGEYDYDEYDEDEEDGDESGERRIMKKQSDDRRRLRKSTSPYRHISRMGLEDSIAVSSKLSTSTSISQKREQIFNWRAINFGLIAGFQIIKKPHLRLHLLPESPGRSGGGQSDREGSLQDLSSGSQTCLPSQSLSAADTGHAIANPRVTISHNMCTRSKELEQKVRAWKKTMTYALKSMGPERMTREGKQKHRRESLEEKDIHSYHIYTLAQQVIRKQTHNLSLRRWFKAARSVIFTFYIAKAMAQKSIEIFMRLPTFMDIGDYYRMQARASTKHFIDATSFQLKGFKGDGFCMNPEVVNILLEDPQLRTEAEINLVLHKLQQIDSFCDFPLHAQRAMARLGFYCFLLDKRVIISQGQVPYNFYFILSGQAVASTIEERDGCVFRQTQRMLSKGQMFGEKAIIENCLRTETVRARTNMQLLYIDRSDYVDTFMPERLMDGVPEYVKFLSSQSWMKEWPVHLLMDNSKMCYPRYFRQQQVIVANSMISEDLYVIRSGECQVVMPVDTITTTWRDVNRLLSEHFLIKDSQLVTGLYREEQMLKMQDRKLKSKVRPLSASDIRETGSCSHQQLLPDQTQRLSTLLPLAVSQLQNLYHQRSISIMTSANTLCMLLELSGHGAERFHPDCFLQQNSSAKTAVPPVQEEGSSSGQHSTTLPKKPAPVSKARHGKSGSAVKKGAKKHVFVTASSGTFGQGSLSASRNLTQSSELDGVLPKKVQPTCLKKERGRSAVKSGKKKSVRMSDSPSPDPHVRELSRGQRPSCWKPAPQSSWAKRRQYQVPKQCRPQVSHEASGPTRPRRGPLACVHILTLGEGDVFGFDQLDMEVCAQTKSYPAALVSCGAEVIVMKKRFFLQHANYTVQQAVHLASISVPSPEEVKNLWRIEQARDLYQRSLREQLTGPHNRY